MFIERADFIGNNVQINATITGGREERETLVSGDIIQLSPHTQYPSDVPGICCKSLEALLKKPQPADLPNRFVYMSLEKINQGKYILSTRDHTIGVNYCPFCGAKL